MVDAQHSPTPWRLQLNGPRTAPDELYILAADDTIIDHRLLHDTPEELTARHIADAQLIVTSVNAAARILRDLQPGGRRRTAR